MLRWLIAAPLRLIGHRYVRIGGLLAITGLFLAYQPTNPAFYGVFGGFLVLSLLARPIGRLIAPKTPRKAATLPSVPEPAPRPRQPAFAPPSPPPAPAAQHMMQGPRRPLPSPVMVAVPASAASRSPDEASIRARLAPQLQQLLASA